MWVIYTCVYILNIIISYCICRALPPKASKPVLQRLVILHVLVLSIIISYYRVLSHKAGLTNQRLVIHVAFCNLYHEYDNIIIINYKQLIII